MANRYWDVNRGQHDENVTTGSSSGSGNVEVVLDLAANMTRDEVIRALQSIINFMLKGKWPPA